HRETMLATCLALTASWRSSIRGTWPPSGWPRRSVSPSRKRSTAMANGCASTQVASRKCDGWRDAQAVSLASSLVQLGQRVAASGISIAQKGQTLVVGGGGGS